MLALVGAAAIGAMVAHAIHVHFWDRPRVVVVDRGAVVPVK